MKYGKFRKQRSAYEIYANNEKEEWESYYGEDIRFISNKVNELGLYNEVVEILNHHFERYTIRFPSNGLRCVIDEKEIREFKYNVPDHLFEL